MVQLMRKYRLYILYFLCDIDHHRDRKARKAEQGEVGWTFILYLLQFFLPLLVSELHGRNLLLKAILNFFLWALSFFCLLQLCQQFGQLETQQY